MLIFVLIVVICIVCIVCAFSSGSGSTEPTEFMTYELVFSDRRVTRIVTSMEELQNDIERIEKTCGCKFIAKRRRN